jgi:hypothetical protein
MKCVVRILLLVAIFTILSFVGGCESKKEAVAPEIYQWGFLSPMDSSGSYPTFRVRVNYEEDLADVVDNIRIKDDTERHITGFTSRHFPEIRKGTATVEIALVSFNQSLDFPDVLDELDRKGLRPADFLETFALFNAMRDAGFANCAQMQMDHCEFVMTSIAPASRKNRLEHFGLAIFITGKDIEAPHFRQTTETVAPYYSHIFYPAIRKMP